jgi:hypothetical protein
MTQLTLVETEMLYVLENVPGIGIVTCSSFTRMHVEKSRPKTDTSDRRFRGFPQTLYVNAGTAE